MYILGLVLERSVVPGYSAAMLGQVSFAIVNEIKWLYSFVGAKFLTVPETRLL